MTCQNLMEIREGYRKSLAFRTERYDEGDIDKILTRNLVGIFLLFAFISTLNQVILFI